MVSSLWELWAARQNVHCRNNNLLKDWCTVKKSRAVKHTVFYCRDHGSPRAKLARLLAAAKASALVRHFRSFLIVQKQVAWLNVLEKRWLSSLIMADRKVTKLARSVGTTWGGKRKRIVQVGIRSSCVFAFTRHHWVLCAKHTGPNQQTFCLRKDYWPEKQFFI